VIGFLDRVAATIERHSLIPPGTRIAAAVSGGADSVCLLYVLLEFGFQPSVLHINHNLRGDESRRDADFVADLAGRLGLGFHLHEPALAPGNLEQSARKARLASFRQLISQGLVDRVATGHTRSDQAETVLFRFLRGSGSTGLSGILPITAEGVIRPLLDVECDETEEFLRSRAILWREDSTNASLQFARNRIRHVLIPQIARDWNPAIVEALANVADWAQAEESKWDTEIQRLASENLITADGAVLLDSDWLRSVNLATARRVVRHAIRVVRGDLRRIEFGHVGSILKIAASPGGRGRVVLPGVEVLRSFSQLRFSKSGARPLPYRVPVAVPGITSVADATIQVCLEPSYNKDGCLDWGDLPHRLELRSWQAGDRYRPQGSDKEEKLKTLFQRERIPIWERWRWPILVEGDSILWTRRFGPAHNLRDMTVREITNESGTGAPTSHGV